MLFMTRRFLAEPLIAFHLPMMTHEAGEGQWHSPLMCFPFKRDGRPSAAHQQQAM